MENILAIDYGEKRVGLALASARSKIPTPYKTITVKSQNQLLNEIHGIIIEWNVNLIVLGIPKKNKQEKLSMKILDFSKKIKDKSKVKIEFIDEDYSSTYAESILIEQRQQGRKKKVKKEEIDRIAATIILQSWLENELL
ncbi:MAG: Holliday junction resolvase RuvX [Gammaproteobacteria bacterium]|nr:Holliday junction resolvase RuvX [Gammaproteobacteria bacterium]|tara:strand:- start:157 stop:576 length:420 start_codon:yes stop_codon:yes gene_type:complete